MDFRLSEDQLLLADGVRDYLAGTHGPEVLRRLDAGAAASAGYDPQQQMLLADAMAGLAPGWKPVWSKTQVRGSVWPTRRSPRRRAPASSTAPPPRVPPSLAQHDYYFSDGANMTWTKPLALA